MPSAAHPPAYVAVIADVVESRQLDPAHRARLQAELQDFLSTVNDGFGDCLAARFVITTGDEFQGLLRDSTILPDLIWDAGTELPRARVRFGIGQGILHTPLRPDAVGMDGPAFHAARDAILAAKREGWDGGVFRGFGDEANGILDGLAHLLENLVRGMTPRQRQLVDLLRNGMDQSEVAERLGVSRQAVSKQVLSIGWNAYRAGEDAFRTALGHFSRDTIRG